MPELLAIQKEAYQTEARTYDNYSLSPLMETLDDMRTAAKHSVILKAEIGGVPAGSVRCKLNGTICEIGRLSVKPAYQRQGIGSALLRACETVFAEAQTCELFTGSRSAANIKLYESHGYRRTIKERIVSPKMTLVYLSKQTPRAKRADPPPPAATS